MLFINANTNLSTISIEKSIMMLLKKFELLNSLFHRCILVKFCLSIKQSFTVFFIMDRIVSRKHVCVFQGLKSNTWTMRRWNLFFFWLIFGHAGNFLSYNLILILMVTLIYLCYCYLKYCLLRIGFVSKKKNASDILVYINILLTRKKNKI